MACDSGNGKRHAEVVRTEFLIGSNPTLHLLEVLHKGVNGVLLDESPVL